MWKESTRAAAEPGQHMEQALQKLHDLYCGGAMAEEEDAAAAAAGASSPGA
jgi:hypothetical protein